jgi:hypothetical protein
MTAHILTPQRSRRRPAAAASPRLCRGCALLYGGLMLLATLGLAPGTAAVTLAELKADPNLTPDRLMKHFASFKYMSARETRPPETFLAQEAGDCDDFATLAADLLRERGYSPRLVAVYMPNEVHVVCYVPETRSYLDYNCRNLASPLVNCGGDLSTIAAQVARSFHTQWRSASEFTVQNGAKHFVMTAFR